MKKGLMGFVAVCVLIGFRPVARRMGRRMAAHCEQMAAQCRQMAAQAGGRGEAVGRA